MKLVGKLFLALVVVGAVASAAGGPQAETNAKKTQTWVLGSMWNGFSGAVMAVVDMGAGESDQDAGRG